MDAGCPRAWAGAITAQTERFDRDLDRPARVLADVEAFHGELGPVESGAFIRIARRLGAAISTPTWPIIGVLSPPNAPAKLQRGHIRVIAKRSQFNKPFDSFSVR